MIEEREFIVESCKEASADDMKAAGFQELVRCKNCKWWTKPGYCFELRIPSREPDWFCAYGERTMKR